MTGLFPGPRRRLARAFIGPDPARMRPERPPLWRREVPTCPGTPPGRPMPVRSTMTRRLAGACADPAESRCVGMRPIAVPLPTPWVGSGEPIRSGGCPPVRPATTDPLPGLLDGSPGRFDPCGCGRSRDLRLGAATGPQRRLRPASACTPRGLLSGPRRRLAGAFGDLAGFLVRAAASWGARRRPLPARERPAPQSALPGGSLGHSPGRILGDAVAPAPGQADASVPIATAMPAPSSRPAPFAVVPHVTSGYPSKSISKSPGSGAVDRICGRQLPC